ncbi:MAG: acyl-CoA dehydratase activase [Chloroflexota bacterium]|nr:acyl-CoA dehydratase activase [Chloroflexota bacterium]
MRAFRMGIDVGSTTAKVVILNRRADVMFSAYRRHNAETLATLQAMLQEASRVLDDVEVDFLVTGSAGLGISEKFNIPFIQEVIASAEVVRQLYPEVKTLIDIGGEDAKMIFFNDDQRPDIRMNGSCAGGTGAFIDQMATLLNIPVSELDDLAEKHTTIYPMASRCGVFAKTDVQNLLSREIAREDIVASIFNAVVLQTLATLSRGYKSLPVILFGGGPLTFLPALKGFFMQALKVSKDGVLETDNTELLPAIGAALADRATGHVNGQTITLTQLAGLLNTKQRYSHTGRGRLVRLFADTQEFNQWRKTRTQHRVERVDVRKLEGSHCFLGIDSGSTTTKLVLIDEQGRIAFDYYRNNNGNAINAVQEGLERIQRLFAARDNLPHIARSIVTGYGEDLIRTAFGCDEGLVETLAHYRAARAFDPSVSFILDIGGQDMKAIFVKDGHIQNIEINEACSSGCGSFIESFAMSMGYTVSEFAQKACTSEAPCDLGTRCTVFMNSKVKQALREGAGVSDISAGLAYSVIKNAIHKVLKITDTSVLGDHIIVQGGTFRNPAIHRAMERLLGKQVLCPGIAELMGAYGAALTARDTYRNNGNGQGKSHFVGLQNLESVGSYEKQFIRCRGCENKCTITKLTFQNENVFYTGNRCEKIFTNSGKNERKGVNLVARKVQLLFDRETHPPQSPLRGRKNLIPTLTLGIPRALNMYENFPFWNTLFVECGFKVQLSAASSNALYEEGVETIMSENICFPAKLAHGHIYDLIKARVDRIFFPMVFYEQDGFADSVNSYNCPIISGYPDVMRSAIDPEGKFGIPLDMPAINFQDKRLLRRACHQYLAGLGVGAKTFRRAFDRAVEAQQKYKAKVRAIATDILNEANADGRPVILLMGRPYHADPQINHKVPEILTDFGLDVITEDAIPLTPNQTLDNQHVLTQWEYSNRFYHAARWVGQQDHVETVQLNSFACGPDAINVDEVKSILCAYGKSYTIIRIDEIESIGSVKLRLRSMIESLKERERAKTQEPLSEQTYTPRKTTRLYQKADRQGTILVPRFSHFCSPPITRPLLDLGYQVRALPPANRESVEVGLKYTNNEICYPAIIVIGDLIKALQSGKYELSDVAVGISQTGGQCRASCYLSLLKRALIAAGFEDIPVISLTTGARPLNEQPGFKLDIKRYAYKAMLGLVFADALSAMYHATAIRELHKGAVLELTDKYLSTLEHGTLPLSRDTVLGALEKAVTDFNEIETVDRDYPKVGIVGEIYIKYNSFSNNRVVQWLMDQELEVIVSPLAEFFLTWLVGAKIKVQSNLQKPDVLWFLSPVLERYVQALQDDVEAIMKGFRYHYPHHTIRDIARKAEETVTLTHQYGEGWLIAGEIGVFEESGVQNVLCLQPFGCIANQVVAKGVEKRLKERYPQLNLLFLDSDAGTSEVNFLNRLYFFVNHAQASLAAEVSQSTLSRPPRRR